MWKRIFFITLAVSFAMLVLVSSYSISRDNSDNIDVPTDCPAPDDDWCDSSSEDGDVICIEDDSTGEACQYTCHCPNPPPCVATVKICKKFTGCTSQNKCFAVDPDRLTSYEPNQDIIN